jgi:hypothetical protein
MVEKKEEYIHIELQRVRERFAKHVAELSKEDLHHPSIGTDWTNCELRFHMLFSYALLDAITTPFNRVDYLSSLIGAELYNPRKMQRSVKSNEIPIPIHEVAASEPACGAKPFKSL